MSTNPTTPTTPSIPTPLTQTQSEIEGRFGLSEAEESEREITELKVVAVKAEMVRDSALSWLPPPTQSVYYPIENPPDYLLPGQWIERVIVTKTDAKGRIKESFERLEGILCPVVEAVFIGKPDRRVLVGASASLCKCNGCVGDKYSGGTYWTDLRLINMKKV